MIMLVAAASAHAQSPEQQDDAAARASTATTAEAAAPEVSGPIDQLTLSDALIAATGWRPIGERRGELRLSTGTDATHQGAARASDTLGGAGIELTGSMLTSTVLGTRNAAAARIEHSTESDRARIHATYGDEHLGLARQSFTTDVRVAKYGAAWTA